MFNFFKHNKETATRIIWNELCELDSFLHNKLGGYIQSQTSLDGDNLEFINKPFAILEKQRNNIKFELYDFAKNQIFIETLQVDINKLLNILRETLKAINDGDKKREKDLMVKVNSQLDTVSRNFSIKLDKFRELAEKYTDDRFIIGKN